MLLTNQYQSDYLLYTFKPRSLQLELEERAGFKQLQAVVDESTALYPDSADMIQKRVGTFWLLLCNTASIAPLSDDPLPPDHQYIFDWFHAYQATGDLGKAWQAWIPMAYGMIDEYATAFNEAANTMVSIPKGDMPHISVLSDEEKVALLEKGSPLA